MDDSPVHEYKDKWYFWDETWADRVGPFDTRDEAVDALASYCEELNFEGDEKNVIPLTDVQLFERSFYRPKNFFMLSASLQWAIDKKLGLLDWNANNLTDEDRARYEAHYKKQEPRSQYTEIGTPSMRIIEECGELIQAVMKGERFGYDAHHPDKPETTNLLDVRYELQDIINAVNDLETSIHIGNRGVGNG
jgi:NTP pyrophosphatase (non-canonical NTP hydrolase)